MSHELKARSKRWSRAELDRLVEEAIVDSGDELEQLSGLYTMIENDLAVPFETAVLGMPVIVESVELTERDIVAICRRGKYRQRISLVDLPLPSPPPPGAEWIAAYCHWSDPGRAKSREE